MPNGIEASTGSRVTPSRSRTPRSVGSTYSSTSDSATPAAMPASRPAARLNFHRGLVGASGGTRRLDDAEGARGLSLLHPRLLELRQQALVRVLRSPPRPPAGSRSAPGCRPSPAGSTASPARPAASAAGLPPASSDVAVWFVRNCEMNCGSLQQVRQVVRDRGGVLRITGLRGHLDQLRARDRCRPDVVRQFSRCRLQVQVLDDTRRGTASS